MKEYLPRSQPSAPDQSALPGSYHQCSCPHVHLSFITRLPMQLGEHNHVQRASPWPAAVKYWLVLAEWPFSLHLLLSLGAYSPYLHPVLSPAAQLTERVVAICSLSPGHLPSGSRRFSPGGSLCLY